MDSLARPPERGVHWLLGAGGMPRPSPRGEEPGLEQQDLRETAARK